MSDDNIDKDDSIKLPKSLQGIEKVLLCLNETDDKNSSMRSIHRKTGLSLRVIKNILLQLEKFNQVERVFEGDSLQAKWRITKFGKKVVKEANLKKDFEDIANKWEYDLIDSITIPKKREDLEYKNKGIYNEINSKFSELQVNLSKMIGPVMNSNNPVFEDLLNFIIVRIDYLQQQFSNIPINPLGSLELKKVGEESKKLSKKEQKELLIEIYFLNSLILNELKKIDMIYDKFFRSMEKKAFQKGFGIANDLSDEIRILTSLVNKRKALKPDYHILSPENLIKLEKNQYEPGILDDLIEIEISEEEKLAELQEILLRFHAKVNEGEIHFENHTNEILTNIPLYALYQLIKDEHPELYFTIEQLEDVIFQMTEDGLIPGLKAIRGDSNQLLKVVQLKPHDISKDEERLMSFAMQFEAFNLADMIKATGWRKEKTKKMLDDLTEIGILRKSKSILHGERWYIATAWDWNSKKEKIKQKLDNFEKKIRSFIKEKLKLVYGNNWWEDGIPEYVRERAQKRLEKAKKRNPNIKFNKIDFLTFSDYFSVILRKKNWDKVFSRNFHDKRNLEYPLEKLREIRNNVSHVHLNPEDLDKYEVYIKDVMKYME